MKYLLKAHAIKGDTEGFNTVMAEYTEAKLPTSTSTPILNSALRLTLNAPGDLDWKKFSSKYTELFPEDMPVENAETYEILFAACGKYEKADQAIEWYNDLITKKQDIVTKSNRDAFRNAVGDKIYREHYKQLLNHIRKFVLDLDSRPTSFIPSERLLTRMTRVKNDSVVSTLMKKEAVRVELAVQELAAAGFLESCEAISESSGIFFLICLSGCLYLSLSVYPSSYPCKSTHSTKLSYLRLLDSIITFLNRLFLNPIPSDRLDSTEQDYS